MVCTFRFPVDPGITKLLPSITLSTASVCSSRHLDQMQGFRMIAQRVIAQSIQRLGILQETAVEELGQQRASGERQGVWPGGLQVPYIWNLPKEKQAESDFVRLYLPAGFAFNRLRNTAVILVQIRLRLPAWPQRKAANAVLTLGVWWPVPGWPQVALGESQGEHFAGSGAAQLYRNQQEGGKPRACRAGQAPPIEEIPVRGRALRCPVLPAACVRPFQFSAAPHRAFLQAGGFGDPCPNGAARLLLGG